MELCKKNSKFVKIKFNILKKVKQSMIKFGTDGWRGEIARDFTFVNLQKVALATALYLKKTFPDNMNSVIGYDARFLSKEFAEETARIFAWQGIRVFLTDGISSTPQVSLHTKEKAVAIGIIITASHNPAIYNGFKIKANFGGPAIPSQIDEVEKILAEIWDQDIKFNFDALECYNVRGMIELFDAKTPYTNYLKTKIDFESINKANFKILYDPMHGSGIHTIHNILPNADEIHSDYNPSFGDIDHPEPIGECLGGLMNAVKNGKYDIGIATDGDADRLGLVDEDGNFVDSHKIFMIVLKNLYETRGIRGCVVKTVSLTSMVNKYCEKHNIELFETPVGFKYTAEYMTDGIHNVIVGGEESGGLGNALHIPERDGLFNAGLVLEAMAKSGKSLKTMCDELTEEFGTHIYRRIDRKVTEEIKQKVLAAVKSKPKQIAGYEVKEYNEKDGTKFIFENGWLLIRASGTEPLLRFYSEADSIEKVNKLLNYFIE